MKKVFLVLIVGSLSISLFGCRNVENEVPPEIVEQTNNEVPTIVDNEKIEIKRLIEEFGSKLKNVSLLSPTDILENSIKENYGDYLSQTLLNEWLEDPSIALGRLTSSPWPDRIEIISIVKVSESSYIVEGEVIEITSVEKENNGVAAKRPIILVVNKYKENWLIDSIDIEQDYDNGSIVYTNEEFGFNFTLPLSWKDYSIVLDKWEGRALGTSADSKVTEDGEIIIIRHPLWTSEKQYQDIPIMIFNYEQWELINKEELSVGAAPIGPKELGRNSNYIFALPARYNFAFPIGYEEIESILESNPLKAN